MAKQKPIIEPIRLTPEQKAELQRLEEPMKEIFRQLEALKAAGIDVSIAEERLKTAERLRKAMLEHF